MPFARAAARAASMSRDPLLLGIDLGTSGVKAGLFAPDGSLIARFFFVQDPDGYKYEVLQRHGHYQ